MKVKTKDLFKDRLYNEPIVMPNNTVNKDIQNRYILSFPNFDTLQIVKENGDFEEHFNTLKEYLRNNIDTYIEIVKSLPLNRSTNGGASKKRIPKRKL